MYSGTEALSQTTRCHSLVKHLACKQIYLPRKIDELLNIPTRFKIGILGKVLPSVFGAIEEVYGIDTLRHDQLAMVQTMTN